jgi:hypothetical protein
MINITVFLQKHKPRRTQISCDAPEFALEVLEKVVWCRWKR